MKAKLTFLAVLGLSLLLALSMAADGKADDALIHELYTGCIDWCGGTVRAIGIGAPIAINDDAPPIAPSEVIDRAMRMAQARLLATVGTIRIDSSSRVADRMARSVDFRDGLTALARNASISRQEILPDGSLEVELTMNLTGGFGQFVLPEEIRQVQSVTTMTPAEPIAAIPAVQEGNNDDRPYTGLILDAIGIGAQPSLVPVIVDESGDVVYGPAFVSREFAVSRGMSGFAGTLTAARNDKRVGDRPMVVRAIRTHSTASTELVISSTDAARLRSSVVHLNFLKACRVSIVMDPPAGS